MNTGRRSGLARIAHTVVRKPRAVLAVWFVAIGALAIAGLGVADRLASPALLVPGTDSKQLDDVKHQKFGNEDVLIVLLRGPAQAIETRGPTLARALDAVPRTRVISPWQGGAAVAGLRRSPSAVAIVVAVSRKPGQQYPDIVPPIEKAVHDNVRPPLRADVTGQALVGLAAREAAKDATQSSELIVLPVLGIVLFLVFGSPIAATIPGVIGGTSVGAGFGAVSLLIGTFTLDSLATSLVTMMGLGLGVDYSLLIISRFREETSNGRGPAEAAAASVVTAGRTVVFSGAALVLAMLVAAALSPGVVLVSAAVAVIIACTLSVIAALFVVPAMLTIVGPNLERWSLYAGRETRAGGLARFSRRITRRPIVAITLIFLAMLAGTAQAFALHTGPPSVGLLPKDSSGRHQYEAVSDTLGPGWGAPFEIVMDGRGRPVTDPTRLRHLARFQQTLERDPGVVTVAGLAAIEQGTRPLASVQSNLKGLSKTLADGRRGLARLSGGLGAAHSGAARIQGGLRTAAAGAALLQSGSGQTATGGHLLAEGMGVAAGGARQLLDGMRLALEGGRNLAQGSTAIQGGSKRLLAGLRTAADSAPALADGARRLADALRSGGAQLGKLRKPVGVATGELAHAWNLLLGMTVGKADPSYAATLQAVGRARGAVTGRDPLTGAQLDPSYPGLDAALRAAQGKTAEAAAGADRLAAGNGRLVTGLKRLSRGAAALKSGVDALASGNRRLAAALASLTTGAGKLAPGLDLLATESDRLAGGLDQVTGGVRDLATGLGSGASSSGALTGGIGQLESGVKTQQSSVPAGASGFGKLQKQSPDLFQSGYFYLASIDGSPPGTRSRAGLVVNVDKGGDAARMVVVPTTDPENPATKALHQRLKANADRLGRETGSHVIVGGPTAIVSDYNDTTRKRLPLITLGLALVTLLVLIPVLRSLLLPLAAVILNIVTVGATFGILALLFNRALLGGPGYIDAVTSGALITVIFGLSIDYEVFILARMREEYLRSGDTETAIARGLQHTARIVTGAAAIMIAVFLAFSVSDFMSVRQFGVGLAVAILLDAFVIRLIALPAVMRVLGRWNWWLPRWLDRILPQAAIELPERQQPGPPGPPGLAAES